MPVPKNTRYRWKGNVRLAFHNNKVIEVKKKGGTAKLTSAGRRLMKAL